MRHNGLRFPGAVFAWLSPQVVGRGKLYMWGELIGGPQGQTPVPEDVPYEVVFFQGKHVRNAGVHCTRAQEHNAHTLTTLTTK